MTGKSKAREVWRQELVTLVPAPKKHKDSFLARRCYSFSAEMTTGWGQLLLVPGTHLLSLKSGCCEPVEMVLQVCWLP